ncbi:MAG: ABC transporter ATP-binding protein, partial [Gemmatimonadales bacterium]
MVSGAFLALGLLPDGRRRAAQLTLLGAASTVLDTVAIGLVVLVIQFAMGEVQAIEGYGALGLVANLAYQLSTMPVWLVGGVVFMVLMTQSLLGAAHRGMTEHLRLQAYQTFRERVFANWLRSDEHTDRRRGPGAMVNSIQNETWEAADAIFQYCTLAIACAITAVYVLVMAATSVILTGVAAVLALLSLAAVGFVRVRLWEHSQESISRKEELARHMIAHLSGLRTIKAFRAEEASVARSYELSSRLRRTFEAIVRLETLLGPVASFVNAAVLGAVLVASWYMEFPGAITLAFVIVLYRAQPKAQLALQTVGKLARSHASVTAVAELMRPPRTTDEATL